MRRPFPSDVLDDIPTHADVLEDQTDLARLCRDRPLETFEHFTPNAFYGHGALLRARAAIPPRPFPAVIPHGPELDRSFVWRHEEKAALPAIWSYPGYRDDVWASVGRLTVPGWSPFLAALELTSNDNAQRKGTVFFPAHSTHHLLAAQDARMLATLLASQTEPIAPVSVCLYWRDIERGLHAPFLDHELRVVSAGHMFDPRFHIRLAHLLREHRFAAGSTMGTHAFLAVAAGCSYVTVPGQPAVPPFGWEGRRTLETDGRHVATPLAPAPPVRAAFLEGGGQRLQAAIASEILASQRMQTPAELRELERELTLLDRWGRSRPTGHLQLPPARARRAWRRLRSQVRRWPMARADLAQGQGDPDAG